MEVTGAQAPSNRTVGCLLELQTNTGSMFLCADSFDDAVAWKASMIEVKNANVRIVLMLFEVFSCIVIYE